MPPHNTPDNVLPGVIRGASADADQALAVPATPANAVDGPSGFDPSRSRFPATLPKCRKCGAPPYVELFPNNCGEGPAIPLWICAHHKMFGGNCPSDTAYLTEDAWLEAHARGAAEYINGTRMPDRIWLTDEGSGDICWATDPDPTGDGEAEAVEYIRAASAIETQRATTEGRGPKDESAAAKPDAQGEPA